MSNRRAVVIPVLLGLVAALSLAWQRVSLERAYNQVEVAADYGEVCSVAGYSGLPVSTALARLKGAGLVAVSLEEPLLRDLVEAGALTLTTRLATGGGAGATELSATAGNTQGQAAVAAVAERFGGRLLGSVAEVPLPAQALLDSGGGLDPTAIAAVQQAGLVPIARLRNSPGLSAPAVDRLLEQVAAWRIRQVVFAGDQVLGFRALRAEVAASLVRHNLTWARIEFAEQKGEDKLAELLLKGQAGGIKPRTYLRLHSVTAAEMLKLQPEAIVERYRRAAQERNIRIVFVRMQLTPSRSAIDANVKYLGEVRTALLGSRLRLGEATTQPWTGPGRLRMALIGVCGVAAAAAWLLAWLGGTWSVRRWLWWWVVLALPATVAACAKVSLQNVYGEVMGLLAALTWPTLGGRWAWLRISGDAVKTRLQAVGVLWVSIGAAVAGGLMTAGLLHRSRYFLHHDSFSGVKLAHLLPLVLVAVMLVTGVSLPRVDLAEARRRLRAFWSSPLTAGLLIASFSILAVVAVMVVRSGNEGLEVSSWELRFRAVLERVFIARPRTKEFLLGDPALLLAALAPLYGRRRLAAPLLAIGMVGVVGTFNTFCHLHTPLTQSLLRTFHALWLSTLLGLLAAHLLWRRRADG